MVDKRFYTKTNEVGDMLLFDNGRYIADIEYKSSEETILGLLNQFHEENIILKKDNTELKNKIRNIKEATHVNGAISKTELDELLKMNSKFTVKHLKKILEPLEDDLEVVAECRYDDRYVLTDISTYEDENTPKTLVIELGHTYDVLKTVTGEYYDD